MYSKTTIVGAIKKIEKDKKDIGWLEVSTTRPFPDDNHIYHRDLIIVKVWKELFETVEDYIYLGQLILIEGRVESFKQGGIKSYVFAERIERLTHNQKNPL